MDMEIKLNLRMFEGDGGAGAAPAAGDGTGESAEIATGVLEDGTEVDDRLAERMRKQEAKRKQRGQAPLYQTKTRDRQQAAEPAEEPEAENPADQLKARWEELKKGEFKDLYGQDVQETIQARFKNQTDAAKQLEKLQPMLSALAKQRGIDEGNLDALSAAILDDDSLYEDEAEAAGMTVESYRTMKTLEQENERYRAQQEQNEREQALRAHYAKLAEQAERMKQIFPDFDLRTELQNDTFLRMTSPEGGLSVEDAYYAIHHRELAPQAMAYGIQRAQEQMSKTLQANRARPAEGAMGGGQATNFQIDPKHMSKAERQELIRRARYGEKIVL